ncbi:MAG: hypothetical protein AAF741_10135 [Bacteroidota bacterium]
MSHEEQNPEISQDALNDYGKRQYKNFDAAKANIDRRLSQRYGYSSSGSNLKKVLSMAAALAMLLAAWWCLRPQLSGSELELSQIIAQQSSPLPTTSQSAYRSAGESQSTVDEAIKAYEQGDYETAVDAFESQSMELLNAKQSLFFGHALFQLKRYQKALLALDNGLQIADPQRDMATDRQIVYWTAKTYAASGRCDLTLRTLAKIAPPGELSQKLASVCESILGQP